MQVVLIMFKADGERRSFSLPRDVTLVGRREDCDLRIPLGDVSRKHCRLIRDGDTLRLEDLGSSNGTFHNGVRVQEAILQAGDNIRVGPVIFTVQIDGSPPDDHLMPPGVGEEAEVAMPAQVPELETEATQLPDDVIDLEVPPLLEEIEEPPKVQRPEP